jgi:hypothetical protein
MINSKILEIFESNEELVDVVLDLLDIEGVEESLG